MGVGHDIQVAIDVAKKARTFDHLDGGVLGLKQREKEFHDEYMNTTIGVMLQRLCDQGCIKEVKTEADTMLARVGQEFGAILERKTIETHEVHFLEDSIAETQRVHARYVEPLLQAVAEKPHSVRLCTAALKTILVAMQLYRPGDTIAEHWLAFILSSMSVHSSSEIVQECGCRALAMAIQCGAVATRDSFIRVLAAMDTNPTSFTVQACGRSALVSLLDVVDPSNMPLDLQLLQRARQKVA